MCGPGMGHHGMAWGFAFPSHLGMFCCEPPTKEEKIAFLEQMRERLTKSIERLNDKISKMKAESSESES